ncbi:MAG: hypothetical protein R2853_20495 [Thermomicrobiales bacterium]
MFTLWSRALRPPPPAPSWICRLAPALLVPLLAASILIGPAPVQDPRPGPVPESACQARLAEAEATLAATEARTVVSSNAPR